MAAEDATPKEFFVHPHTAHLANVFFFYAYGNTPPSDLLQHIPHDAVRADILCLGCGDLRDFLYSIVLHGRRGVSCGPLPRQLTFTLNDWEPAIHARNLMLLQLMLDSRDLLKPGFTEVDTLHGQMEAVDICGSLTTTRSGGREIGDAVRKTQGTPNSEAGTVKGSEARGQGHNVAFAQTIGVIFSAMYNVFVDAAVLRAIQHVAGRLAASLASSEEWKSTELGRLVHFADDRSLDRVRNILLLYADEGLQSRVSAASVRRIRSADISEHMSEKGHTIESGAMGLASLRRKLTTEAFDEMVRKYLTEGILDPFPLLLVDEGAPPGRAPSNLVNPLLLVTETKGTAFSLHYGAFPLEAFHTEVTSWKLRDDQFQDEHGRAAPRVLKQTKLDTDRRKVVRSTESSRKSVQDAWFGAALEQLAQMCGGFLAATRIAPMEPGASTALATPHIRISIHAGDAINFCDALLAASTPAGVSEGGFCPGESSSGSPTFKGIAFQQGTLQPLRLRKDTFEGPRAEFDVISTSNLADHLGSANMLVACAPLLRPTAHSVLLLTFMASSGGLHLFKDTATFYEKQLCMDSQTAAVLLGVVPVSSMSSVVGHADTTTLVWTMGPKLSITEFLSTGGCPRMLRLVFKLPAQVSAATVPPSTGPTSTLGDISPREFASLTLPVYKAMFDHMPTEREATSGKQDRARNEVIYNKATPGQYTAASFARLLALAGRRLRLRKAHFYAALTALTRDSGMASPLFLSKEQVALFHAMGLSPFPKPRVNSIALSITRVVLLVPPIKLAPLRNCRNPNICLSFSNMESENDDNFMSVHMAFVRVHRGRSRGDGGDIGWFSLSGNLDVRDTREDDPEAELMVSTIVPTFMMELAAMSQTQLQLRRLGSILQSQVQLHCLERMGVPQASVLYSTNLANTDDTAIMTPDRPSGAWIRSSSSPPLTCPNNALSSRCETDTSFTSVTAQPDAPDAPFLQRFVHGKSFIDQSLELINQTWRVRGTLLVGRVKLTMANEEARENLAKGELPKVEAARDPCSVRVILGKELVHVAHFPFPVMSKDVRVVYNKSKGCAHFTVLPLKGFVEVPFILTTRNVKEDGWRTLLSTFCWPMCVPLASLPRLDFNAEWAHHEVMGPMSAHNPERSSQQELSRCSTDGSHSGFRGMKESILGIAASACATHREDNPIWKHEWACITVDQRHDKPALWVWVNEILLDPSNQALVLDCCIMPVDRMDHEVALQLGAVVGGVSPNMMQVCPEEFELWTALLPVAVERGRQTYAHASDCIYSIPGAASPIVCSCGKGKDLPPTFMESMESAKARTTLVYRAALSPLYARPEVAAGKGSANMRHAGDGVRCAKCGHGSASKRCSRCREVTYCSKRCQSNDWKNHKPKCAVESGAAKA